MFIHEEELEKLVQGTAEKINKLDFKEFEECINSVEDIQYKVDKFGRYTGGIIFITNEDPRITIDTESSYIQGSWGISRTSVRLDEHIVKLINFFLHHNYNKAIKKWSA